MYIRHIVHVGRVPVCSRSRIRLPSAAAPGGRQVEGDRRIRIFHLPSSTVADDRRPRHGGCRVRERITFPRDGRVCRHTESPRARRPEVHQLIQVPGGSRAMGRDPRVYRHAAARRFCLSDGRASSRHGVIAGISFGRHRFPKTSRARATMSRATHVCSTRDLRYPQRLVRHKHDIPRVCAGAPGVREPTDEKSKSYVCFRFYLFVPTSPVCVSDDKSVIKRTSPSPVHIDARLAVCNSLLRFRKRTHPSLRTIKSDRYEHTA